MGIQWTNASNQLVNTLYLAYSNCYNFVAINSVVPVIIHATIDDQADRPTLIECIRFRGKERRINIPQEIGVNYQDFGLFLLEDENRQRVKAIAHSYQNKAEEINKEILEQWIIGKGKQPVTWKTLTEVLRDIELSMLAGEIEVVKCHEDKTNGVEEIEVTKC